MFEPFYLPFQRKGKLTFVSPFSLFHLNFVLKIFLSLLQKDNLLIVIHEVKKMEICYPESRICCLFNFLFWTFSDKIFVRRNISLDKIFFTYEKFRHFCPILFCPITYITCINTPIIF